MLSPGAQSVETTAAAPAGASGLSGDGRAALSQHLLVLTGLLAGHTLVGPL
jgi:hypothetical protein